MISFDNKWRQHHPNAFGTVKWYDQRSMISPYWAKVDEVSQDLLIDKWPEARSRVFYQTYERNAAMSQGTKDILSRAQKDVSESGKLFWLQYRCAQQLVDNHYYCLKNRSKYPL